MTEDQYQIAKQLKAAIDEYKSALDSLLDDRNYLGLPQEMYDRQLAEKLAFMKGELIRLEAEFDAR